MRQIENTSGMERDGVPPSGSTGADVSRCVDSKWNYLLLH